MGEEGGVAAVFDLDEARAGRAFGCGAHRARIDHAVTAAGDPQARHFEPRQQRALVTGTSVTATPMDREASTAADPRV